MSTNTELNEFTKTLSPDRQKLIEPFFNKDWFKNTDLKVQKELLSLPEDHDGFIKDLAGRPDEIGEVDVLKLQKLGRGHFLIIPVFEVRSNITNQVFTYEYVSWKTGNYPGMRGIIFLETEGKITHFLVSKTHKFSTTNLVYDSIGGLFFRVFGNKPVNFAKKIEHEICFHLGVDNLIFTKVIDLGRICPDYGLTNNSSTLFAAVVDVTEVPNIVTKRDFRDTHKPVGFEIDIVHISEFGSYINKIEDNYFLGAVARLITHKEIELEY